MRCDEGAVYLDAQCETHAFDESWVEAVASEHLVVIVADSLIGRKLLTIPTLLFLPSFLS